MQILHTTDIIEHTLLRYSGEVVCYIIHGHMHRNFKEEVK